MFLMDFPCYLLAAVGARPVSCLRLLQLARHVTPGRLQLQITNANCSAPPLHFVSLRCSVLALSQSFRFAPFFARAKTRQLRNILRARFAPCFGHIERHARTISRVLVYYLLFLFIREQTGSSLRSEFSEIKKRLGKAASRIQLVCPALASLGRSTSVS